MFDSNKFLWCIVALRGHFGRKFTHHVEFGINFELRAHFDERALDIGWHNSKHSGEIINNTFENSEFFIGVSFDTKVSHEGGSGSLSKVFFSSFSDNLSKDYNGFHGLFMFHKVGDEE